MSRDPNHLDDSTWSFVDDISNKDELADDFVVVAEEVSQDDTASLQNTNDEDVLADDLLTVATLIPHEDHIPTEVSFGAIADLVEAVAIVADENDVVAGVLPLAAVVPPKNETPNPALFHNYPPEEKKRKAKVEEVKMKVEEERGKWEADTKTNDEEETKKGGRTIVLVPAIGPTECKLMISFNDSSAGEDAENLANFLTDNGHPTFCTRLYCPCMVGSWRDATIQGVIRCKFYVMLMTHGWQNSQECEFETNIAMNRWAKQALTPIPVWYEDFDHVADGKGKNYTLVFASLQSVQRKHKIWMKIVLKQLGGAAETNTKRPLPGSPTSLG